MLPIAFLTFFLTTNGVDVYTIEARQPIVSCNSACVWCGPPQNVICAQATATEAGCLSPAWSQCIGTGQQIQLAMTYSDGSKVWVDYEHFAMDRGRPVQAHLVRSLIFTDSFESGGFEQWTTSSN